MEPIDYSDKRFLVVEDQRPFLVMLRSLLQSIGAKFVTVSASGESALSECRKQKFDFVITDIHLGQDKKNGYELIEELRVLQLLKPSTVILVISADSARDLVFGSIEREPDDYLVKPFSQAQLKTRLMRAYHRRVELEPAYQKVYNNDNQGAIDACLSLLNNPLQYKQQCHRLLTDLYLRTGQGVKAIELTENILDERPVNWAYNNLAKAYLVNNEFNKALDIAHDLIKKNRFNVEAHDILASVYEATDQPESALLSIKSAISIAPLSFKRQNQAISIARRNKDFVLAKDSCLSIWEMSKRSIHKDVMHFCNYVRSILDIAEHSEDKKQRNRFQQEALITLQRNRADDSIMRNDEAFDFDLYETLVHARINALDGKMIMSKKLLEEAQIAIENRYQDFPLKLMPDSFKVMNDIGDFEEAEALAKSFAKNEEAQRDPNIVYLLNHEMENQSQRSEAYKSHNKTGIENYRDGKFESALQSFNAALKLAPVNIGVALNLLQCIVKILEMQKKPDSALMVQCKEIYKLISSLPLRKHHQQKWDELLPQVTPLLEGK